MPAGRGPRAQGRWCPRASFVAGVLPWGGHAPRWRYWDVDERLEPSDEGGLELAEIEDSARLTTLVQRGFDTVLRHFRISFDDHSTYDVIRRWIRIEYEPRRRN